LRIAFDLADTAQKMVLQRMRREHPEETDAAHMARLQCWIRTRPGAEHGDCTGRPIAWPRRRM
jgi:hypothetical protein